MAASDKRRQPRFPIPGKLKLHWSAPDGCTGYTSAQCLNISQSGLRAKLDRKLEAGLMVRIESSQFHLAGVGYVRDCRQQGLQYVVGIEFAGGMTWTQALTAQTE